MLIDNEQRRDASQYSRVFRKGTLVQETRYTEKQILYGMYECWCDAMGTDSTFDAETRVDLHMKADELWDEIDLADIFYRFEKQFDFDCTLEEWDQELGLGFGGPFLSVEEWERDVAPKFTFGAIARFIQKRAINTVSFEPVTVIHRECGPAGAFYGIEQLFGKLPYEERFGPSTKIIDVLRGRNLNRFWSELWWRTEFAIPRLSNSWRDIDGWGCLIGGLAIVAAIPISILTENYLYLFVMAVFAFATWYIALLWQYWTNPLPPELQTFRDLAVLIAEHNCDAVRKNV
ncbi:hypothetical protein [Gimesia sp.]|uniref:hypothetical protein n=1 Tax=Gimesia sp. TaxID=2024833 RepID=UPI003A8F870B